MDHKFHKDFIHFHWVSLGWLVFILVGSPQDASLASIIGLRIAPRIRETFPLIPLPLPSSHPPNGNFIHLLANLHASPRNAIDVFTGNRIQFALSTPLSLSLSWFFHLHLRGPVRVFHCHHLVHSLIGQRYNYFVMPQMLQAIVSTSNKRKHVHHWIFYGGAEGVGCARWRKLTSSSSPSPNRAHSTTKSSINSAPSLNAGGEPFVMKSSIKRNKFRMWQKMFMRLALNHLNSIEVGWSLHSTRRTGKATDERTN